MNFNLFCCFLGYRLGAEDGAGTVRLAEVAQRYHGVHHGWINSTISQGLCYCLFY